MMSSVGRCPKCGKLIAYIFPLHTCKPTKNFICEQRKKRKGVKKNVDP